MRKLTLFVFLFVLLPLLPLKAETWSCSYLFNGEAEPTIFIRQGKTFETPPITGFMDIVYEDDNLITLHRTRSPLFDTIFVTLLDKKKRMFASVGLEIGDSTSIVEGPCTIF